MDKNDDNQNKFKTLVEGNKSMNIQEVEEKLKTTDKFEYYSTADNKTYVVAKTTNGFSMTKKESLNEK